MSLGSYLPVVLEVAGEVDPVIVGLIDVGGLYLVGASHIMRSTVGNGRSFRSQQELRAAGQAPAATRNIGKTIVAGVSRVDRRKCLLKTPAAGSKTSPVGIRSPS